MRLGNIYERDCTLRAKHTSLEKEGIQYINKDNFTNKVNQKQYISIAPAGGHNPVGPYPPLS